MTTLSKKTLNGLLWSFVDSWGAYIIRFGFSVAIARALSPSDYGLMGMIIIFIAIGNILTEGGFSMALIQKQNTSNRDYSTIFYYNLFISITIYFSLFFFADYISSFFNEPRLINVIRVAGLSIIFGAFSVIQITIFSKALSFKIQTFLNLTSVLISGIIGVIIAYNGFSVWALVYQTVIGSIIRSIGLWFFSKWRPSLIFSWISFKELNKYGYKIFLQGITNVLFSKIYFPIIGKSFSVTSLGYYTNASSFSEIVVQQTTIAYGKVLFPVMSGIQKDRERLLRSYFLIFRILSFIIIPISVIAVVSCHAFVEIFLTNKWLPAVPYMQLFLLEGFFYALYMHNLNFMNSIGESGSTLKIDIIKKACLFVSLLLTYRIGIISLIIGQIASSLFIFIFSLLILVVKLNINIIPIILEYMKIISIGIILITLDYLISFSLDYTSSVILLSKIILVTLFYLFISYILKLKALLDICVIFEQYIPKIIKYNIIKRIKC